MRNDQVNEMLFIGYIIAHQMLTAANCRLGDELYDALVGIIERRLEKMVEEITQYEPVQPQTRGQGGAETS